MFALITFLAALLGYGLTQAAVPRIAMTRAMDGLGVLGVNTFSPARRIDATNQRIIRSSPDLTYRVCVIDARDGPVRLQVAATEGYGSLSVFDARTDVVFLKRLADGGEVWLFDKSGPVTDLPPSDVPVVKLRGGRAIALIRRLGPARGEDVCAANSS